MTVGTPAQTVGPYFSLGLGDNSHDDLVDPARAGSIAIRGAIHDGAGEPVGDALVELWQADGCARATTTADGSFSFTTVKPSPATGVDGEMQAPHIAVSVFARGLLGRLVTRIYFPDEPEANDRDPLLRSLDDPGRLVAAPDGEGLRFEIVLQGARQTVFLDV